MPNKLLLEQLTGTPPDFSRYSSYHLHKVLEELEALVESHESAAIDTGYRYWSDFVVRTDAEILIKRLSAWLLRRFRAQLDQRHEEELIEDWKGAFDER